MLCDDVMMVFSNPSSTRMQADTEWSKGDRELAHKHSQNAKKWGIGGIVSGIVLHLANIALVGGTYAIVYSHAQR